MKLKIKILLFSLLFVNCFYSQSNRNEFSIDSIIIEITKNYSEINSDQQIKDAAINCYKDYKTNFYTKKDSALFHFNNLLLKYNLGEIKSAIFDTLNEIKLKNKNYIISDFIKELAALSNSFTLNYPKEKIFMVIALNKKYLKNKADISTSEVDPFLEENHLEYNYFSIENIIILILIFIIFFLFIRKKPYKEVNLKESNYSYISNSSSQGNYEDQITHLKRDKTELQKQIEELKIQLTTVKSVIFRENSEVEMSIETETNNMVQKTETFYFRQPNSDGIFRNDLKIDDFEPSLSMFKFSCDNKNKAFFEYCGDMSMSKLISNNPNTHLSLVCDFLNAKENFNTSIISITKGEVQLENDIWVVTKKAVIKFS